MLKEYARFAADKTFELLAIDSPTGVYASHGYERSHLDGVENTLKVLKGYVK